MQRTLLASIIAISLSACISDSDALSGLSDTEVASPETTNSNPNSDNDTNTTPVVDEQTTPDSDEEEQIVVVGNSIPTDAEPSDDENSDSSGDDEVIADDAASGSSDGGEVIPDDAASGSSDGGEVIPDDAASGSSDGGEVIPDDAASGSSDGGQNDDTSEEEVEEPTQGEENTDAGEFSSGSGGDVIRTSSLASDAETFVCTTASNQNNFSNIYVGDFILHNNAWRPWRAAEGYEWEQCINANRNGSLVGWSYDWGNGRTGVNGSTSASGDYYVRSYPELIYGVKDEYRTSAPQSVTGLPVYVSDMPTYRIDYSYDGPQYGESRTVDASNNSRYPNGTSISGERNVAIESFFYEPSASGQCSTDIVSRDGGTNHVYEVMVWLDAGAERLPAGPSDFVADLTIRGEAFKVYTKGADNRYIAFVAQNPQTSGTLYWNDFTDWARENAHQVREQFGARSNSVQIQDDWCMANIIVGTEIFWGAGNIDIYDWTITQSE